MMHSRYHPPRRTFFLILCLSISLVTFMTSGLITMRLLRRTTIEDVPELHNKSVESARSLLRVKRLRMDIAEFSFDERVPANNILTQNPEAGLKVKSGSIVKVVVSRGTRSVNVPSLIGQSMREASSLLEHDGFQLGHITRYYTREASKNIILDQQPAAGNTSNRGAKINLLVSQGPKPAWFIMPSFRGWKLDDAILVLDQLGIELMEVKRVVNDEQTTGTIIEQTPKSGARIQAGDPSGLTSTIQTQDQTLASRFVTIRYSVPPGPQEVRVKMVVRDDTGLHEIYNAMEKPDSQVTIRKTLQGTGAKLRIYINGVFQEEQDI